jgi:hypothetical protein
MALGSLLTVADWEHGIARALAVLPMIIIVALLIFLFTWALSSAGLLAQVPTFVIR